ncbi:MAG: hypothetical protein V4501_07735 [Pseudomonadota bacterium]
MFRRGGRIGRTGAAGTNTTTGILHTLNISVNRHTNEDLRQQFTYIEETFTASETSKKTITISYTETVNLIQAKMQSEVLLLLPKFLNSHKAYLNDSNPEKNVQQIYVNSRDDKEVREFVRLFKEAGFSGTVIKSTDKPDSAIKAGHSLIKLYVSLPELLLRLRESVKAQELNQQKLSQEMEDMNLYTKRKAKL